MMLGKLTDTCKKIKLDHHLISYTRINPKCIKDLNVSHETMKILEEYIGRKILDISRSNIFAYMSSRTRETKEKKKKTNGLHQSKKFLHSKRSHQQNEEDMREWQNIFTNDTSDKGLISKMYKELIQLNTRKTNNPI